MQGHNLIVVGASAGGIEALTKLVGALPADLPAAILVVVHFPPTSKSALSQILGRFGHLPAHQAKNDEPIRSGHIYVAPPDFHLLVNDGHLRLSRGPRENRNRPAVDPLFRTAARAYGAHVVGVVLSGMLDDGTAGLRAIKLFGGVAIAQSPDEALFDSMPRSAIERVSVDRVLPVAEIASYLVSLAHEPVFLEAEEAPMSDEAKNKIEKESEIAAFNMAAIQSSETLGTPIGFSCPECGGTLWELRDGELVRYRCRVGHGFTQDGLVEEQAEAAETALWVALRALEERAAMQKRLEGRSRELNQTRVTARFAEQAREAEQQAVLIRKLLLDGRANGNGRGGGASQNIVEESAGA